MERQDIYTNKAQNVWGPHSLLVMNFSKIFIYMFIQSNMIKDLRHRYLLQLYTVLRTTTKYGG